MHEIKVESISPEEVADGVTELWAEDTLVAYTLYNENDLVLMIEPSHDGGPVILGVHSLANALAEVRRVLALHWEPVA